MLIASDYFRTMAQFGSAITSTLDYMASGRVVGKWKCVGMTLEESGDESLDGAGTSPG